MRTSSKILLLLIALVGGGLVWMASRADEAEIEAAVQERLETAMAEREAAFAEQEQELDARAATLEEARARAEEPVLSRVTPEQVETVLQQMGLAYERGVDSQDDPMFSFKLSTYDVTMYSYGCEAAGCTSLRLYAYFRLDDPPTVVRINEWNRTKRFSTAYLDSDGDPCLDEDLIVRGGVTPSAIEQFVLTYRSRLSAFASHIGY
jgi:hypothetical protein